MFTTTLGDKLTGPVSFGGGEEVLTWRRITIELQNPYYVIEYQMKESGTFLGETVVIHFLADLLNICKQANRDSRFRIIGVQLLSPKRMNKTSGWKLDNLREIWRSRNNVSDQLTFVTTDGTRYSWGHYAVEKDFSKTATLIWEMSI